MRPRRSLAAPTVALIAASWLCAALPGTARERPAAPAISANVHPGAALPTVRVRQYRMSGRIRPLLVWMGRDDIGIGRITWREGDEARGYELAIGTDPSRAPRRLNRWGFVSEQLGPGGGHLLALMFGTAVGSFAEASRDADSDGDAVRVRGLRGRIDSGVASRELVQIVLDDPPTVHDLDAVLARLPYAPASSVSASSRASPGERPGLLTAAADLLARVVARTRAGGVPLDGPADPPVVYVFGRDHYELRLRRARMTTTPWRGSTLRAVQTAFEIRTLATGARTRFELTSGVDGDLAAVPLVIRWQPRWWLEIGLHLQEETTAVGTQIRDPGAK